MVFFIVDLNKSSRSIEIVFLSNILFHETHDDDDDDHNHMSNDCTAADTG
jgi:hypothetical protein